MAIRGKPSLDEFLQGGNEPAAQAPAKTTTVSLDAAPKQGKTTPAASHAGKEAKVTRIKKLFELPKDLIADLERACLDEKQVADRRVTQMEIVERSIRRYLKTDIRERMKP